MKRFKSKFIQTKEGNELKWRKKENLSKIFINKMD